MMDDWMSECLTEHNDCISTANGYRPTRLLKLGPNEIFQLVNGDECPEDIRYAALSYSWGPRPAEEQLRLLATTWDYLHQEQPVASLPTTFRDAIKVARHFGVDHLWIDRLCIFQDSAQDWERESSRMHDVYQNAHFSIAALSARDADGGLFFERDPASVVPSFVRIKTTPGGEEEAFMYRDEDGGSWKASSWRGEPLTERSWVLQERLLAPRTLYFGSKQIFWECRERKRCEVNPLRCDEEVVIGYVADSGRGSRFASTADALAPKSTRTPWKRLLDAREVRHTDDDLEQVFLDWNATVMSYAGLKLSFAKDKLVAISGIAQAMKSRLEALKPGPHRYLAGMWEESLLETLCWHAGGAAKVRPAEYRAPSWSWASLDGLIGSVGVTERGIDRAASVVRLMSAEVQGKTPNGMGEVESGEINLMGCRVIRSISDLNNGDVVILNSPIPTRGMLAVFDTQEDVAELASLIWVYIEPYLQKSWRIKGLMFAQVEPGSFRCFRRVGIAYVNFDTKDEAEALLRDSNIRTVALI
ncbi:heterokaryon incompatibility protein-domain-containing protein [Microdochium bolleyi]|uniref:Heterokaryon incompatibility protein-domain-containing protein n=1 Tax=Microdochium bolleyi TaxID=196109 RepID=A0A136ITF7_9PEZI|nr:heterokaryon incompatibility protein-domain-containing protein [Microdochium bolleyi]